MVGFGRRCWVSGRRLPTVAAELGTFRSSDRHHEACVGVARMGIEGIAATTAKWWLSSLPFRSTASVAALSHQVGG